jgi:hypothetical protein
VSKSLKDSKVLELVNDLWWFIENVDDETPDRTQRFFALRERVRDCKSLAEVADNG